MFKLRSVKQQAAATMNASNHIQAVVHPKILILKLNYLTCSFGMINYGKNNLLKWLTHPPRSDLYWQMSRSRTATYCMMNVPKCSRYESENILAWVFVLYLYQISNITWARMLFFPEYLHDCTCDIDFIQQLIFCWILHYLNVRFGKNCFKQSHS